MQGRPSPAEQTPQLEPAAQQSAVGKRRVKRTPFLRADSQDWRVRKSFFEKYEEQLGSRGYLSGVRPPGPPPVAQDIFRTAGMRITEVVSTHNDRGVTVQLFESLGSDGRVRDL
ncbi:hypothetical protein CYMTET_3183 [Cymbomonas tetramitiformis]|uniref:Uncharacterized protein n=1 Tax=Cymbomonas tetramitiformis TaxID=36881 RepID=A0AAE0LL99_9CHLO|nr:hypothetical protein CYMTET_3183 [Cymbomonas tetramitiformis]